jgi:hypothetical protein
MRTIAIYALVYLGNYALVEDTNVFDEVILLRPPPERSDTHIVLSHFVPQLLTLALDIRTANF